MNLDFQYILSNKFLKQFTQRQYLYNFSILTNPEIMRQLQSLQAQMQLVAGMQNIPVSMS